MKKTMSRCKNVISHYHSLSNFLLTLRSEDEPIYASKKYIS